MQQMDTRGTPWNSAWNRIGSTDMAYVKDKQSAGMFAYTQMPVKFTHPSQCRNTLGLVGGNEVSNIAGNVVDLESDLLGITRVQSKCVAQQYKPACPLGGPGCPDRVPSFSYMDRTTGKAVHVDTTPRNLPSCQFTTLPGMGAPQALYTDTCYPSRF
jgi:hypothetical protein